jgi:nitrate reductase NapE component
MEGTQKKETAHADGSESPVESEYPATVESLSEKWRSAQQAQPEVKGNFLQRHFLVIGIGIALLVIALMIVIGGFSFLVWNAR